MRARFKCLLAGVLLGAFAFSSAAPGASTTPAAPISVGSLVAPNIRFVFAIYYPAAPATEPMAALRSMVAKQYRGVKLLKAPTELVKEPVVVGTWVANAQKDYRPPSMDMMQRFAFGLSREQAMALQGADRALVLDFAHPGNSSLGAYHTALTLAEGLARKTNGYLWDEETREVFTADAWQERRIQTWKDGIPGIPSQTVIHAYRGDSMVRAITLGMAKFGLPDIVANDFSWSTSRGMGNLINGFAQVLLEGQGITTAGQFDLDVRSIRHTDIRAIQTTDILPSASSVAKLTLAQGKWEDGDPRNRLIELGFDRYPGPDRYAKQSAMLTAIYGSTDEAKMIRHNAELLAASKAAVTKLPALRAAFQKGLQPGEYIQVKAPFATTTGGNEWMWVEITKWNGDSIEGLLRNDPFYVPSLKAGQIVKVSESKVFDFLRRYPDGKEEGNETSKIIIKMKGESRKQ